MPPFVWKLHVVARCEPLQALLTSSDDVALSTALSQSSSSSTSAAMASNTSAPAATADAPANHLERWKQWKLDDAHIARLTSAQGVDNTTDAPSPLSFLANWITNARFFARGKRGVLYAGELQSSGAGVVVKLGAASVEFSGSSAPSSSVDAEAKWLRTMNRMGLGAQLVASGPGWFICERLEGHNVVDFLSGGDGAAATHANARWVLREMLCQCFAMDLMGINKEEMTHPHRHIIIHPSAASSDPSIIGAGREWKCTFVDFEKCIFTKKPKNITQLCQFLSSPRMVALLGAKGVAFEVLKLRLATKKYKQSPQEDAFGELMRIFGL